ncbi:MAG: hypothetical protein WB586_18320 [Chthoniobacterales bacterium]
MARNFPEESKKKAFEHGVLVGGRFVTLGQLNYKKTIEALGRICVEFQRLETHLKAATTLLLDPDDWRVGTIVTTQLPFKGLLDLFYALYHHRFNDPNEHKELTKFLKKCKAQ